MSIDNQNMNFKILHTNISSVRKIFDEFKCYLAQFETNDIECIVLTETWQTEDPELFSIKKFRTIYNFSKYNQNDGTLIYIREDLHYSIEIIELLANMNIIKVKITVTQMNT